MKRVWTILVLCLFLVGCGTDPREGLVTATVGDLQMRATKVANIKLRIEDAVKKTEAGKTPDFKDALQEVDALKKIAKEMQDLKLKADNLKDKTTEEEKAELTKTFKNRINTAIEELSKKRKELNETIVAVEMQHKDALKEVQAKLVEAEGEFEAIARQR